MNMQWAWLVPVLICGSVALGSVLNTWIRAKHGNPLDDDNGNTVHRNSADADRKIDLLSGENEKLTGRISRLEERIAVLERIATDPSTRTAREIDALR
jgi:hypothetical protein